MVYPDDYISLALPAMRNAHTQPRARATKLNQVISVEQLPDGCVLISVDFGQARARDPFVPLREDLSKGGRLAVEASSNPQRAFDESSTSCRPVRA